MPYKAFISYSHAADARLAPALQSALRRIARPWYRRALFRIFLDRSSLAANPALWNSIEAALEQSEFFLLLASTSSARSEWVERELDWWLSHRKASTILIAVTDGEIEWRLGDRDFDWQRTTALNTRLRGQFPEEPLWVDLRWARAERKLSLGHARFRSAVLDVAPALYGKSREDLDDEDTRHYRSARRLAAIAILLLAVLAAGIAVATRSARNERSVANCRQLAAEATSFLGTRLDLALLLGVESSRSSTCVEGRSALLTAFQYRPHLGGFLSGHTDVVTNVAYSPDGRILAASSWDQTARLWDPGKRRTIGSPFRGMYGLSFSPDGTLLASAHADSITLWKMPGATPAGELEFDKRYEMYHASFSPDGKLLATSNDPTGTTPSAVFLWDAATRRQVGKTLPARVFAFSPDGKTLATDGENGKSVVLWDLRTRRQMRPPLAGHTARIRSITFSPDGQMLASGAEDHSAIVWDLSGRHPEAHTLTGHRAPVNAVAFHPQSPVLATGSGDGSVILWDLEKWQPMGSPMSAGEKPVFSVAFSPEGRTLASNFENQVVIWNLAEDFPLGRELKIENQPKDQVAYSPDGKTMASVDGYHQVTLSNAETGEVLHDSIGERLTHLAFSPDGAQLATVNSEGEIAFWDTATGESKGTAPKTDFRLWSVTFSPDGRTLAAGGDAVILLWDIPAHKWKAQIVSQQKDRIWSVAFSPDGKLLASGGNTSLGLWDARTGAPVMAPVTTDRSEDYLLSTDVAFSRDGKLLALRAGAQTIALWDVAHRWQLGGPFSGHSGTFTALAFSPDAKMLATGSTDGTVALWDVATRQPLGRPLDLMGDDISSLSFRPDGRALATLSENRLVIWDMDEASWRATACRMANRNLTHEEWSRFFGLAVAYRETCPAEHFPAK